MFTSSIAIGTPLKWDKEIHRPDIESSDMEIDGIHISKKPKLFQDKEVVIEDDRVSDMMTT